jgi:PBSX family phage terminase large subunit
MGLEPELQFLALWVGGSMAPAVAEPEAQVRKVELLPAQMKFLKSRAPEVLYSGAFGAGKSRALCYKLLMHASIPGNLVGLCRKKHTTLRQTTLRTLLKPESGLPPVLPEGSYTHNRSEQVIHLIGGGDIYHFGFDEQTRVGSLNLGACFVDEGIELDEEEYTMLIGRCRNPVDPCRQICVATNPGSPVHFLYDRFFNRRNVRRHVIQTTSLDNFFLPPDYLETLRTLTGIAFRRYVMGQWVAFEGAVYPMFDYDVQVQHHPGPFSETVLAIDWGFTHPFVVLVLNRIDDDTVYVSEEVVATELTPSRMLSTVRAMVGRDPVYGIACDPSEPKMIQEFVDNGLPAMAADNDVMFGIRGVQDRLTARTLIVSPECVNLIRGLQSYVWKDGIVEKPVKVADDEVDALRYGVRWWDDHMAVGMESETVYEPEGEEW